MDNSTKWKKGDERLEINHFSINADTAADDDAPAANHHSTTNKQKLPMFGGGSALNDEK